MERGGAVDWGCRETSGGRCVALLGGDLCLCHSNMHLTESAQFRDVQERRNDGASRGVVPSKYRGRTNVQEDVGRERG